MARFCGRRNKLSEFCLLLVACSMLSILSTGVPRDEDAGWGKGGRGRGAEGSKEVKVGGATISAKI